jgi:hypothetical protein
MKKGILLAVVAALLITPAAAMASHGNKGGKSAPKVMYVLRGKLSAYTPYNAGTQTAGSITIAVSGANYHGKALKGQSLTFPVGANTKISLENGVAAIADGDRGIVKVKAAKKIAAADLAATLQATTARQIVDQGA